MLRFLVFLLSLLGTAWLVVGWVLAPVLPGGWVAVALGAVLLTIVPLGTFIGMRVRRRYPNAFLRVVVFRTFWYAQVLLLVCAVGGLAGAAVDAPFGAARTAGRLTVAAVAAAAAVVALAGYFGSRRLA